MKSYSTLGSWLFLFLFAGNALGQEYQLIAHRGGIVEGKYPENSSGAIEAAIERGYWMVEADIRESKDGKLIVHHDEDFLRFYGDSRKVAASTWEEISQLRSKQGGHRPLLFSEFAALCKGRIQLMLDTKPPQHSKVFYQEMEEILLKNELLEKAYVIGSPESRSYFRGKARVGIKHLGLKKEVEAGIEVGKMYFLFMHGNELDSSHLNFARLHKVPIVPSVNLFHYREEDPMRGAYRDISWLREAGVTQFQIDSEYDQWFSNKQNIKKTLEEEASMDFNLMTFNIRYPNPADGINFWPNRKDLVASMIRYHDADILGIQEAFRSQLDELMEMLPGYSWLGLCRTSGDQSPEPDNEFSAILFKKDRFEVLEENTFWLSDSPESVGVAGWDAALPRIVTWAKFRDKYSGKSFFHFNTHFDHRGKQARQNSAKLLLERVNKVAGVNPVLVTGDFNAVPESLPYQVLTSFESPQKLSDALMLTESPHHGPLSTLTNGFKVAGVPGRRIDYIFIKNGVRVLRHAILSDSWGGRLPSDHLPVIATCRIP